MTNSSSGPNAVFTLNLQQKRQAALLYHWMSLDYLKGLKDRIDALIKGADVTLDAAQRQERDALIANDRWGVRDTSANWSTHVYPALEDFRKSTIRLIAWRAVESYCGTGAYHCSRMISEFSSMWMTPEEEQQFQTQFQAVYDYASKIDHAAGVGGARQVDDYSAITEWQDSAHLFPRLPKFRVLANVEGVSGKKPPRTGVYVSRDDPHATLQFAWRGNDDGILGDSRTFNDIGLRLISEVGRSDLWIDDTKLVPFAIRELNRNPSLENNIRVKLPPGMQSEGAHALSAMVDGVFTTRPCKWYFVERVEGELDDEADVGQSAASGNQLRCPAGDKCPRDGMWYAPARTGSRRHFRRGDVMPDLASQYGATIWEWDGPE